MKYLYTWSIIIPKLDNPFFSLINTVNLYKSVVFVNLMIRFYSCLIRRRRGGRSPLLNDVGESPLFPRGGKEVTRKAALWYTAKPTNDMRQETMAVRRIASHVNLSKTIHRQVSSK